MKKKIFAIATFLCAFATFNANAVVYNYQCSQYNTKPWGCDHTDETTEGNTYSLKCYNAGAVICQFKDGTCPTKITWQQASDIVRGQITKGLLSGTLLITEGCTLSWSADDVNNFSFNVEEQ